jgi:murein DD-endopeptidase MepM/ murein hydrolase activator NlpD
MQAVVLAGSSTVVDINFSAAGARVSWHHNSRYAATPRLGPVRQRGDIAARSLEPRVSFVKTNSDGASSARAPGLSRRGFISAATLGALGLTAFEIASLGPPASAAVQWGHPFDHPRNISSRYGYRDGGFHHGLDYPLGATWRPQIRAVADGTVFGLGWHTNFGNFVEVKHSNGWSSFYAHMQSPTPAYQGQSLTRGQVVGTMGGTGRSYGDHLHIEIRTTPGVWNATTDPYPLVHNAPLAGTSVAPPKPPLESNMAVQLWLYTPTNSLLLVDHVNMTYRNLGNVNNEERARFDSYQYQTIGEPAWTNRFGAFKGITRPNVVNQP